MVTEYSKELDIKILARFKCSKSANTTKRSEITFFLQIMECLSLALSETNKGLDLDDLGYLDLSDFSILGHLVDILNQMDRRNEDIAENQ